MRDHRRRSVYLFVRRNLRYPIFAVFDKPDTNASCPRRNRSTTAPQSLMLLNSRFSLDAARRLARSVVALAGDDRDEQITAAYLQTLGWRPTAAERKVAREFLERQSTASTSDDDASFLTHLCLVLFNLNEFVYLD